MSQAIALTRNRTRTLIGAFVNLAGAVAVVQYLCTR